MKQWTKDEEDFLETMVRDGNSFRKIAVQLNRSIASVKKKVYRKGLKRINFYWDEETNIRLKDLILENKTHSEIANIMKKSIASISHQCCKLKLHNINKDELKPNDLYDKELISINATVKRLGKYKGNNILCEHICLICDKVHMANPSAKLKGHTHCKTSGGLKYLSIPTIVYLVYFKELNLYKPGVTTRTIKERMRGVYPNYEVILFHTYMTGEEALKKEREWIKNTEPYRLNTGKLKSGNTESFRWEDTNAQ